EGFRPMLFDLESDPQELHDLGAESDHAATIARLTDALFAWTRQHHSRITVSPERVERMSSDGEPHGILIGYWDEADFEATTGRRFGDWSR
ncbi:MAG: phosphonate monoester hydrolase, partial [Pararhodobacter sp.]|nr:phosphonate monoester hydrolase [Pararhodobacter sp.]